MSKARLILFLLICASPAILLIDELVAQAIVAGIVAVALVMTARDLRPGETEFFISIVRLPAGLALAPALWMTIQLLPLGVFVHPIWKSAEKALGHPVAGAISVDLGASVIALGQYLSMIAVAFLAAAIAVDRIRAEWLLFALTAAGTIVALLVLTSEQFPFVVAFIPLCGRRPSTARAWGLSRPLPLVCGRLNATQPATQTPIIRRVRCYGHSSCVLRR